MYFVSAWYHRLCVHAKFSIVWCTSYVHDARNYCRPVLYIQSTQPYLFITVQIQIQKIHLYVYFPTLLQQRCNLPVRRLPVRKFGGKMHAWKQLKKWRAFVAGARSECNRRSNTKSTVRFTKKSCIKRILKLIHDLLMHDNLVFHATARTAGINIF